LSGSSTRVGTLVCKACSAAIEAAPSSAPAAAACWCWGWHLAMSWGRPAARAAMPAHTTAAGPGVRRGSSGGVRQAAERGRECASAATTANAVLSFLEARAAAHIATLTKQAGAHRRRRPPLHRCLSVGGFWLPDVWW
jgi:hypothetical protein